MKSIKIFTLAVFSLLVCTSCTSQNWNDGVEGKGPKVTKTLDIATFDGVGMTISGDVYLRQGNTQSVKIEAQQNVIDLLKTEVNDGMWKIGFQKNVRNAEGVKIWITVPSLREVTVSGSGDVRSESAFTNLKDLRLGLSGSGNIDFNSTSQNLDVAISGSGNVDLEGSTGNCDIKISGSGDVSAFDLASHSCNVKISGSGNSSVNVSEKLDVAIAGSGDVYYKGQPSVKSKISGSGDVMSR